MHINFVLFQKKCRYRLQAIGDTYLVMRGNDSNMKLSAEVKRELNGNKSTRIEMIWKMMTEITQMFVRITSHGFRIRLWAKMCEGDVVPIAVCPINMTEVAANFFV